mgnify:CR=1 FL=1
MATDANYSRLPSLGTDDTSDLQEEKIFNKPAEDLSIKAVEEPVQETIIPQKKAKIEKVVYSPDEKKKRLAEHLAMCREKSKISRAKTKAERIANKKPRGRPKKMAHYDTAVVPDAAELIPDIEECNTVVPPKVVPPTPKAEGIARPDTPINQNFNMIDYEKLTNMIAAKMTPKPVVHTPAPVQPPVAKPVNNHSNMGHFLEEYGKAVRADENQKQKVRLAEEKKKKLHDDTRRYYGKLAPTNMFQPTNDWDSLFNTRT